ncbi:hypothetical protein [Streptomyces xanthochromogenes]|uniref:hypothetical protein n=1 Tax=Streptomyces xanthochromogenes TaxID=67384 RepID=UPI0037FCE806
MFPAPAAMPVGRAAIRSTNVPPDSLVPGAASWPTAPLHEVFAQAWERLSTAREGRPS